MFKANDDQTFVTITHKCPACGKELRHHYKNGVPQGDGRCKRCGTLTEPIQLKKYKTYMAVNDRALMEA